jgi:hypothetical protein
MRFSAGNAKAALEPACENRRPAKLPAPACRGSPAQEDWGIEWRTTGLPILIAGLLHWVVPRLRLPLAYG